MVLDTLFENILIEGCSFSTDSSLTGVTVATTNAIFISVDNNAKVYVNNCKTVLGSFYGDFLACSASRGNDVEINGCIVNNTGGVGGIIVSSARTFVMTNCYFDYSNSINKIVIGNIELHGMSSSVYNVNSHATITNNTIIGNDLVTLYSGYAPSALYLSSFDKYDISNNTFSSIGNGIYLIIDNSSFTTRLVDITENKITGDSAYSLCVIEQETPYDETELGKINITNNSIITGTEPIRVNVLAGIAGSVACIGIYCNIDCNISGNRINLTANYGDRDIQLESAIQFIGIGYCGVHNNNIIYNDNNPITTLRTFAAIYVSNNWIGDNFSSRCKSSIVSNNIIKQLYLTSVNSSYIHVRNIDNSIITNNILENTSGTDPEYYIKNHYRYNALSQVVITDNILATEMDNGGILYKDYNISTLLINAHVARNKNQRFVKDINCTEFMQYAHNIDTANPFVKASVMLKSTDLIIANAGASNLNRGQQKIVDLLTWDSLPEGLYYTNATGFDPAIVDMGNGVNFFKNQIIVPIDIPDFTKIYAIRLPIYVKNAAGTSKTIYSSVSLIAGNAVDNQSLIEYIPDPTVAWTNTAAPILAGEEEPLILNTNNFTALYFNPARRATTSTLSAQQNCYLLIGLTSVPETEVQQDLVFAIPYVRLTLVY